MTGSGLQVRWKEHQSAKSSAQALLMNAPLVLECRRAKGKIIWHLTEIEKGLMKKGVLPTEYIVVPFTNIKVS
jgi:hypothetical protein